MEKRLRQNSLEDIQSKAGSMVCDFGKAAGRKMGPRKRVKPRKGTLGQRCKKSELF